MRDIKVEFIDGATHYNRNGTEDHQYTFDITVDGNKETFGFFVKEEHPYVNREGLIEDYKNIFKQEEGARAIFEDKEVFNRVMDEVDKFIQKDLSYDNNIENEFKILAETINRQKEEDEVIERFKNNNIEREDGLEVICIEDGETYLKEVDSTSIHFTISIQQPHQNLDLEYNVGENEEKFEKEFFLKQHDNTLEENFNQEQIDYILSQVNNAINDRLFYSQPQRISFEEHEVATEYFGATDIDVNKVKTVKNDNGNYNCITTIDYQGDKYILNLEAEKSGDLYKVDINSLNKDSKQNIEFKEKVESSFNNNVLSGVFGYQDITNQIEENLTTGITQYKIDKKLDNKKKGPDMDIDF